jgi:hypothetical protein
MLAGTGPDQEDAAGVLGQTQLRVLGQRQSEPPARAVEGEGVPPATRLRITSESSTAGIERPRDPPDVLPRRMTTAL